MPYTPLDFICKKKKKKNQSISERQQPFVTKVPQGPVNKRDNNWCFFKQKHNTSPTMEVQLLFWNPNTNTVKQKAILTWKWKYAYQSNFEDKKMPRPTTIKAMSSRHILRHKKKKSCFRFHPYFGRGSVGRRSLFIYLNFFCWFLRVGRHLTFFLFSPKFCSIFLSGRSSRLYQQLTTAALIQKS